MLKLNHVLFLSPLHEKTVKWKSGMKVKGKMNTTETKIMFGCDKGGTVEQKGK